MKVYIDEKYHHAADPSIRPHKQKNSAAADNQLNVEFSAAPTTNDQSSSPPPPAAVITTTSQISTPQTAVRNTNRPTTRRQSFVGGNPAKSGANSRSSTLTRVNANTDESYGKDIKNIPKATWNVPKQTENNKLNPQRKRLCLFFN